jgi:uncharacterized iron-regulated protein
MLSFLVLFILGQTPAPAENPHTFASGSYIPQRVFDTRRNTFGDFEAMLADLARADVVLVGEQHDDPNTHRLEAAILQGLMRRRVAVTVSLEMFERDVQTVVDNYLAGSIDEEAFLKSSRPWPRYLTDYRSLIEMARGHGWPVVAANVPRKLAAEVSKGGAAALDATKSASPTLLARELQCPKDAYFERFSDQMNAHPAPGADKAPDAEKLATTERYYLSQCVKDETMAESIASAFERHGGRPGTIVHYNGAFHSDFGAGVAERVRRRLPGRRVAIVSVLPVQDLDSLVPDAEDLKRAEYLIYTVR